MPHKKTKYEKIVLMLTRNKIFLSILGQNSCASKIPFAYRDIWKYVNSVFRHFDLVKTF